MAEYPGLPNWGYGAQIPVETLLQLLPINTLPKRLAQEELARVAAQTGLFNVQTERERQEMGLRPAESQALVGERTAMTEASRGAEGRASRREPLERAMLEAQTAGQLSQNKLASMERWLRPLDVISQVDLRSAQTADIPKRTAIDQRSVDATTDYYNVLKETQQLRALLEVLQTGAGLNMQKPRLDTQGRPMFDAKGNQIIDLVSAIDPQVLQQVAATLMQQLNMGQAPGQPQVVRDPTALAALAEQTGKLQPPPSYTQSQVGQTDPATLQAMAEFLGIVPPQAWLQQKPIVRPKGQMLQPIEPQRQLNQRTY